jgi:NADP-dependent 3-hydroxy acid dehydrogenase YdfG
MVSLSEVQSSNARISTALPPDLVGVFVGATSGIGEATLKQFAKHIPKPRAYFVGRSQEAGDRILGECKAINPAGEYIFVKADVSLIRVVDEVCKDIKAKEKAINILCLSAGLPIMDRSGMIAHPYRVHTYHSRRDANGELKKPPSTSTYWPP